MKVMISWDEAASLLTQALRAQGRIGNGRVQVCFHSIPGKGLEYVEFEEVNERSPRGEKAST